MLGPMPVPFWTAPIETVLADLAARPDGLTQIEAERQRLRFGPNRRSDTRKTAPLGLLLNQFRSPLVLLLLFAMALSLFLGETTDGMIVLAIVLGSALLGFLQEYRASSAVAKLLAVIFRRWSRARRGAPKSTPRTGWRRAALQAKALHRFGRRHDGNASVPVPASPNVGPPKPRDRPLPRRRTPAPRRRRGRR